MAGPYPRSVCGHDDRRKHPRLHPGLTTAISLNTSIGDVGLSLALGIILISLSLIVNFLFGLFSVGIRGPVGTMGSWLR